MSDGKQSGATPPKPPGRPGAVTKRGLTPEEIEANRPPGSPRTLAKKGIG